MFSAVSSYPDPAVRSLFYLVQAIGEISSHNVLLNLTLTVLSIRCESELQLCAEVSHVTCQHSASDNDGLKSKPNLKLSALISCFHFPS